MRTTAVLFARPHSIQTQGDTLDLEALVLEAMSRDFAWVPLELLVDDAAEEALAEIPPRPGRVWIYRGWMLTEAEYGALEEVVEERGESLRTDTESYAAAHYMPNYLPLLGAMTPPSRWTEDDDIAEAWRLAQELDGPWIITDHVKSAKEQWREACFVPKGATEEDFWRICEGLRAHRGARFERGFVVRSVVPLAPLPFRADASAIAGGALYDEHRLFMVDGEVVAHAPYHDLDVEPPPLSQLWGELGMGKVLQTIPSPFFAVDVARMTDGRWTILELNDGGVATLPPAMDPRMIYDALLAPLD